MSELTNGIAVDGEDVPDAQVEGGDEEEATLIKKNLKLESQQGEKRDNDLNFSLFKLRKTQQTKRMQMKKLKIRS